MQLLLSKHLARFTLCKHNFENLFSETVSEAVFSDFWKAKIDILMSTVLEQWLMASRIESAIKFCPIYMCRLP